jgi:hypothetical protein
MISLRVLSTQDGQDGNNASMLALARSHGDASLQVMATSQAFRTYHRDRGGIFGHLGRPRGRMRPVAGGSYVQDYKLGAVKLTNGVLKEIHRVEAMVEFMGLKCLDVNDSAVPVITPHPHDEPYVIISIVRLNPSFKGDDELAKTVKLNLPSVRPGETVGGPTTIFQGEVPGVAGLMISAAVFEHDHGAPNKVKEAIEQAVLAEAKKGASALGAAAGAGAGAGDAFGQSEIVKWGVRFLSHGFVDLAGFADDDIGVKTFEVKPSEVEALVDPTTFNNSLISGELPDEMKFNYPENFREPIEGSDAKYQVYFRVRGVKIDIEAPEAVAV